MGNINGDLRETLEDLKESYNTVIYVSRHFPIPILIHCKPVAGYTGFHQHT